MKTDLGFIGKNIRNLRRQRNWTMAELAAKIGMNPVPLGRIERGMNAPSASVIYRLAKTLGVSVDTLFDAGQRRPGHGCTTYIKQGGSYNSCDATPDPPLT